MQKSIATPDMVDRLADLPKMSAVPRVELEWLVAHSELRTYEEGELTVETGTVLEWLFIIVSGTIGVLSGRGSGPRLVMEWGAGEPTGLLPYSRLVKVRNHVYARTRSDVLVIPKSDFPEMIRQCPEFTAYTVHSMVDRARTFNSSALQDEKLMSLGKLAAGLAHELNNPSAAISRSAESLLDHLGEIDAASRELGNAPLPESTIRTIIEFRDTCMEGRVAGVMSALEQADLEDEIMSWLEERNLDIDLAGPLADTGVTPDTLDELAEEIQPGNLDAVLRWVGAGCTAHSLVGELRDAAGRVNELVAAFKSFTYMDRSATPEAVSVEPGLRDTIRVLASKAKSQNASVKLSVEPDLPSVRAVGSELNQVWMNLLDNALDAVPDDGEIQVSASREIDRVVVRVIDNGSGIPEEALNQVFDPFYTTKAPGEGTGLGLDIARQIVRKYHGDISVTSRSGKTEFAVTLQIND